MTAHAALHHLLNVAIAAEAKAIHAARHNQSKISLAMDALKGGTDLEVVKADVESALREQEELEKKAEGRYGVYQHIAVGFKSCDADVITAMNRLMIDLRHLEALGEEIPF